MTPSAIRESMRDRMWSIKSIAAFYEVSERTAWKITAQTGFPPRRPAYEGADPRWSEREVRQYAETREVA